MSRSRLGVSFFLVAHFTAITIAALPPPDQLRPVEAPRHPPDDVVSRVLTPMLDTAKAGIAGVPAVLWAVTSPLRPVSDKYVQMLGIGQRWRMFWDVPTFDVYFRVRWYVQTPLGSIRTATELVYPAHREDRIRLLQGFRDSYRDKAFELMFNAFVERRSPRFVSPPTRPQDLPDQLTPIVRYFGREFARRHLLAGEHVTRTEVWRGTAPNSPRGRDAGPDSDARQRALSAYYDGPVEQRRVGPLPAYYAGEREADIVWVLEYYEES